MVRVGGKQYRVEEGLTSILVDRVRADEGEKVDLEPLLFADGDKYGARSATSCPRSRKKSRPRPSGRERGKKIDGLKFKPESGYKRGTGDRAGRASLGDQVDQAARRPCGEGQARRPTMAHKKGLGSSRNGRDSNAKRLGVKVFAGEQVSGGEIIVRQRGTRFKPGEGAGLGRDHTIFAYRPGMVEFAEGRRVG